MPFWPSGHPGRNLLFEGTNQTKRGKRRQEEAVAVRQMRNKEIGGQTAFNGAGLLYQHPADETIRPWLLILSVRVQKGRNLVTPKAVNIYVAEPLGRSRRLQTISEVV